MSEQQNEQSLLFLMSQLNPVPPLSSMLSYTSQQAEIPETSRSSVLFKELQLVSEQMLNAAALGCTGCHYYFSKEVQTDTTIQMDVLLLITTQVIKARPLKTESLDMYLELSWK